MLAGPVFGVGGDVQCYRGTLPFLDVVRWYCASSLMLGMGLAGAARPRWCWGCASLDILAGNAQIPTDWL